MMEKKIVVCMLLDRETAGVIEPLQVKLGRPFPSAHITIATYMGIESDIILEYTRKFCQSHSKFNVEYVGVGVLLNGEPPLIYAVPRMNSELFEMHKEFHQEYDEYCTGFTSLHPHTWTPHTSLSVYSKEAMEICVEDFRHLNGQVVGMRVVEAVDGEYREMGRFFMGLCPKPCLRDEAP